MKARILTLFALPLTLTATSLLLPTQVQAQAQIDEIIVTARKREESLQSVPISVTAINTESLREKSIENPYDLTYHVPGLSVRQGSATRTFVDYFIRGQGASFGTPAGVAVYFNEVPLKAVGIAGSNLQFYDMQSIQVLKGPQGTLFGRSSTGGAVLYSPQKPGSEFGGFIDTKVGNLDMTETTGAVDIPLMGEKLAVRGAFNVQRRDGFTESQSTGQDLDGRHRESYRIGLNFKPTDWFENYSLYLTNNVDESTTGAVLMDMNAGFPLFNTTPFQGTGWFALALPPGLVPGQQGLCYAINPGNPGGAQSCINERVGRIDALRNDLETELARVQGGGSIRKNLTARENRHAGRNQQFINIATLNAGEVPVLGDVSFKNIVSFNRNKKSHSLREFGATQFNHGVVINIYDLAGFPQQPVLRGRDQKTDFSDDHSFEFQALGDIDGKHSWIVGFFTEQTKSNFAPQPVFEVFNNALTVPLDSLAFLSNSTSKTESTQTGYFAQFTADLSDVLLDGLSLTAGYRHTKSESEQDIYQMIPGFAGRTVGPFQNSLDFNETAPSWTASLDYQVNPELLVYIAHRRGFKPGGINGIAAASGEPGARPTFGPETLDDIEIGLKADWGIGDMAGRTNLAVYNGWYEDVQRTEVIPTSDNLGVITQTNNIAEASIRGLEMENQLIVSEYVQLMLNYAWTDAKYKEWPGFTTNIFGVPVANKKSPFTGVAEHQGTIGARFILPMDEAMGQVSLYAEYYMQSGIWLDDEALITLPRKPGYQSGYENLNLRLDWSNAMGYPVDVGLFARNVLDDEWLVGANSLMGAIGFFTGTWNEPRTYGLQLRWRFGAESGR